MAETVIPTETPGRMQRLYNLPRLHIPHIRRLPVYAGLAALLGIGGGYYLGNAQPREDYNRILQELGGAYNTIQRLVKEGRPLKVNLGKLEADLKETGEILGAKDEIIGAKDDRIKNYEELFEKTFGKPSEKAPQ